VGIEKLLKSKSREYKKGKGPGHLETSWGISPTFDRMLAQIILIRRRSNGGNLGKSCMVPVIQGFFIHSGMKVASLHTF
jgi:hypothetical protein